MKKNPEAWIVAILLTLIYAVACPRMAEAEEWGFKCESYGRIAECKSVGVPDKVALMFAAIHDEDKAYLSAGNTISFKVEGNTLYQIELHFLDQDFPVQRTWARWQKDPKDHVHKVMFGPKERFVQ